MHCPFCDATDTKVIDSRLVAAGTQVRRRRQCLDVMNDIPLRDSRIGHASSGEK